MKKGIGLLFFISLFCSPTLFSTDLPYQISDPAIMENFEYLYQEIVGFKNLFNVEGATLTISVGGNKIMEIDAYGGVAISSFMGTNNKLSPLFTIVNNGNIGVRITSPTYGLDVSTGVRISSEDSPQLILNRPTGGVAIQFSSNTTDVPARSGTRGYIEYSPDGDFNIVSLGRTLLNMQSNGNVGMFNSNPIFGLEVTSRVKIISEDPPALLLKRPTGGVSIQFSSDTTDTAGSSQRGFFEYLSNGDFLIGSLGKTIMILKPTGNVGINQNLNALVPLDVNGSAVIRSSLEVTGSGVLGDTLFRVAESSFNVAADGSVGIGQQDPNALLHIESNLPGLAAIFVSTNPSGNSVNVYNKAENGRGVISFRDSTGNNVGGIGISGPKTSTFPNLLRFGSETSTDVVILSNNAINMRYTTTGHFEHQGSTPTTTDTAFTISGTDQAGRMTNGGGVGRALIAVKFANIWPYAPSCFCNNESQVLLVRSSATADSVTCSVAVSFGATDVVNYFCMGRR